MHFYLRNMALSSSNEPLTGLWSNLFLADSCQSSTGTLQGCGVSRELIETLVYFFFQGRLEGIIIYATCATTIDDHHGFLSNVPQKSVIGFPWFSTVCTCRVTQQPAQDISDHQWWFMNSWILVVISGNLSCRKRNESICSLGSSAFCRSGMMLKRLTCKSGSLDCATSCAKTVQLLAPLPPVFLTKLWARWEESSFLGASGAQGGVIRGWHSH